MQHASQIDYNTVKALAERSGLHLLEVYRLLQGKRVKNPDAWNRLKQARLELAQQQERQAAMRPR